MPILTVTIPTKDRPALLPRAVGSVLDQVDDVEIVVVDDGSSEENAQRIVSLCDKDERIRLIRNDAPGGAPSARNQGLAIATGRYWATLDDDDSWLPGKWDAQLEILERFGFPPDLVVVCAIKPSLPEPGAARHAPAITEPQRPETLTILFELLPTRAFLNTYLVPTELMRSIGGYDERFIWGEHTDVLIRLWMGARFAGTDFVGVLVDRWHDDAAGRTGRNWGLKVEGLTLLLDKHRATFAQEPEVQRLYRHVLGISQLRAGDRRAAIGTLAKTLLAGPGLKPRARVARHLILATLGSPSLQDRSDAHPPFKDEAEQV